MSRCDSMTTQVRRETYAGLPFTFKQRKLKTVDKFYSNEILHRLFQILPTAQHSAVFDSHPVYAICPCAWLVRHPRNAVKFPRALLGKKYLPLSLQKDTTAKRTKQGKPKSKKKNTPTMIIWRSGLYGWKPTSAEDQGIPWEGFLATGQRGGVDVFKAGRISWAEGTTTYPRDTTAQVNVFVLTVDRKYVMVACSSTSAHNRGILMCNSVCALLGHIAPRENSSMLRRPMNFVLTNRHDLLHV